MPQIDRHKERSIPIEFDFCHTLENLPVRGRCSIILITCGSATFNINAHFQTLPAPSVVCLSQNDVFSPVNSENLSAKAFHFDPWYINDREMLYMFTRHSGNFQGIFRLTPQQYLHLNELMLMIGAETFAQSDSFWTDRIRRMLLQALNGIYDIFTDQKKLHFFELSENTNPVTICTDYIHENYNQDISLETLCRLAGLNRTSLNGRFKEQYQCTCIEYLLRYRLEIAQELLSHTNLKIAEIAESCGFKYGTYFERQFKKRLGITPAAYRKKLSEYTAFEKDS